LNILKANFDILFKTHFNVKKEDSVWPRSLQILPKIESMIELLLIISIYGGSSGGSFVWKGNLFVSSIMCESLHVPITSIINYHS